MARSTPLLVKSWLQKVLKMISGKSRSSIRPSPLSSSRLATTGTITTWVESSKGLPVALGLAKVPPQVISFCGSTLAKGSGGSLQVGSTPVPSQRPASQSV